MSSDIPYTFPFGETVQPVTAGHPGNRDCLVLGSLPSALCMRWRTPGGRLVQGFVIGNEPAPWWNGHDQEARLAAWKQTVCWQAAWGEVGRTGPNGHHGRWLDQEVLLPLRLTRDRVCATTLLETYHANEAARHRIDEHYRPLVDRLGLRGSTLPDQPGKEVLVHEAVTSQRDRLLGLIQAPSLQTIITLGTASWRAFAELTGLAPTNLLADGPAYGQAQPVTVAGRVLRWYAFVSPAAPASMQRIHAAWTLRQGVRPLAAIGGFK